MPSAAQDPSSSDVSRRHGSEGLLDLCRLRFDFVVMLLVLPRLFVIDNSYLARLLYAFYAPFMRRYGITLSITELGIPSPGKS